MQTKSKINYILIIVVCSLSLFLYIPNLTANEFNISAVEVTVDKKNDTIKGVGSVEAVDSEGKIIKSDMATYIVDEKTIIAEGSVKVIGIQGNILNSDKVKYNKKIDLITSYDNSELITKEGYILTSNKIFYDNLKKIVSSNENSTLTDSEGNIITVSMFTFDLNKNLFSSIGNIKILDINKNKYSFKELYVDTKKKEMFGSDVSGILDQESFGLSNENDPRFVANDMLLSKNKLDLSKGIFTVCKQKDDKCPPWQIQAKKITHDKIKKIIHYENAILKVYDIPVFFFPKFYHPDPTVKRQSGFLSPTLTNSTTVGTGILTPYFWAISHDKDLTFAPKVYNNENILFMNEYRQSYKNGFLTLDTSYTEGYKQLNSKKSRGSRNHIFADLDFDLSKDKNYESSLSFRTQKTSNDSYFRIHDINTALVKADNTNLENHINYKYSNDDMYLNISSSVYEDLRKKNNSKYEYVLPNVLFGKSFLTKKFGTLDFKSNALYKNYETNKHTSLLVNEIIWQPSNSISKNGFVDTIEGMITNTNYKARNTKDYKTESTVNEISSVISYKRSLPLEKKGIGFSNIFSPNFMVRYAPGHMRDLRGEDASLDYSNLYALNKTTNIESGLSAILGFDFQVNQKDDEDNNIEKFAISMGQAFSPERNSDIPAKTSLDQKMSDVVGEVSYNFSKIGNIQYKFSLDHNFNELNYNEISTNLNFSKINFNLDYLEERKHIGSEHYINSGVSLSFNDSNKLSFETKKNFKTDSTELYDISYEYENDCLTAGLLFRREFYEDTDTDVKPKDSLMFMITFVPFGKVSTPFINP